MFPCRCEFTFTILCINTYSYIVYKSVSKKLAKIGSSPEPPAWLYKPTCIRSYIDK